jgi:hypothetical protein
MSLATGLVSAAFVLAPPRSTSAGRQIGQDRPQWPILSIAATMGADSRALTIVGGVNIGGRPTMRVIAAQVRCLLYQR